MLDPHNSLENLPVGLAVDLPVASWINAPSPCSGHGGGSPPAKSNVHPTGLLSVRACYEQACAGRPLVPTLEPGYYCPAGSNMCRLVVLETGVPT